MRHSETKTVPVVAAGRVPDAWLIIGARGLRSFGYGLLAVLLGVALSRAGFSPAAIGVLITVSLAGDFCSTYLIGLVADRWGRRRTLAVLALLMAATGAVFGLADLYPVLLVAAFFGTLGTSGSETAPFLPIEQAMLPQATAPERRTEIFARYNLVLLLVERPDGLDDAAGLSGRDNSAAHARNFSSSWARVMAASVASAGAGTAR
jgi:MFS family permease